MAIYIPNSFNNRGGGRELADSLIDMVYDFAERWPDKFAIVTSTEDIRKRGISSLVLLPMGIENGAAIGANLTNLAHFYERGIRYMTLTHRKNNRICDSSEDSLKWNGLSPFGQSVIQEMNRLGMMIDISHVSDETIDGVLDLSKSPVIASHSAVRELTAGFKRNLSDRLIKRLAENGGVIQIPFGSYFIHREYVLESQKFDLNFKKFLREHRLTSKDSAAIRYRNRYRREHPSPAGTVSDIVDHIEYVIELVGIDHVGFGSDFEGVSTLPQGIEDVSSYPDIIRELLDRGYGEAAIRKICGGNLLRVWTEVEEIAAELQRKESSIGIDSFMKLQL
jgi:membrane dipeptidase